MGFRIAIHIRVNNHFSSFFSKCWLVVPLQWPVGPLQLSFRPGSNLLPTVPMNTRGTAAAQRFLIKNFSS